jgi:excisionase family DNA binding protein
METLLLSPKALAEAYDVSLAWVYTHVARGTIPYLKLGRHVRFDPEEMRRWLAQHRRGPMEMHPEGVSMGAERRDELRAEASHA